MGLTFKAWRCSVPFAASVDGTTNAAANTFWSIIMHETAAELGALQRILDRSYASAGQHLRSIHHPQMRMRADEVCVTLTGVCIADLATVSSRNRPFVAPVDALFLGGVLWFGSAPNSLRFKHIRRNPHVSAAVTRGEEISILVHGLAHEIDTASGDYERLHEYCREVYGAQYDGYGFWGKVPFAWIEPERMYAVRMRAAAEPGA
jgi:hypothetical protein